MAPNGAWNGRRLVLFTEWEVTRRWLERRLGEALADLDPDQRIASFTGATTTERREALKRAFNADPAQEPLRILICTDAAREGINLQAHCHDLIHIDLPWNPGRLEQRNGRVDRKLQPSPKVWCRYFVFRQRDEDAVLDALVRKTERIRAQLGSLGQVIAERLQREGIRRPRELAASVEAEEGEDRINRARIEMDDEDARRRARLTRDIDDLREALERSRRRVGVDPDELQGVVGIALRRAGLDLDAARAGAVNGTTLFRLDPSDPVFADAGWGDAFDDLRDRPRKRGERPAEWRARAPVRQIAFKPPLRPDRTDAPGVVQVHLEHRLVRWLLSRFLSQGFQAGLRRVSVIIGPGAQPRVVLLGRLAVYGPGAARLHEEIIPVTALWTEAARGTAPLRAFAERGEETTLAKLEAALRDARRPAESVVGRLCPWAPKDARDLEPELRRRAETRRAGVAADLARRGEAEAASLRRLLEEQRQRLAEAERTDDDPQLSLPLVEAEREQVRRDRARRAQRLAELADEIAREPARVRERYEVRATRLEPVGLVYLWPATN